MANGEVVVAADKDSNSSNSIDKMAPVSKVDERQECNQQGLELMIKSLKKIQVSDMTSFPGLPRSLES